MVFVREWLALMAVKCLKEEGQKEEKDLLYLMKFAS